MPKELPAGGVPDSVAPFPDRVRTPAVVQYAGQCVREDRRRAGPRGSSPFKSGDLGHDCNYIPRTHWSRFHHAQVESAHTPVRRSVVLLFDAWIVNFLLDGGAVNVELLARAARFGNFEERPAGAQAVADAQAAHVDPAGGEI